LEFAAPLESVGRSVLMVRLPELFGAVRSRQDLLSLAAGASSLCRGGAPRSVGGRGAESLPASVAVLLSTSAAKLSLDCGGSGRAGLCGAVWTDKLAARSDVTLNTGPAFRNETHPLQVSKDRASRGPLIKVKYFNSLVERRMDIGGAAARPFLPGGKICREAALQNRPGVIASRKYGLY